MICCDPKVDTATKRGNLISSSASETKSEQSTSWSLGKGKPRQLQEIHVTKDCISALELRLGNILPTKLARNQQTHKKRKNHKLLSVPCAPGRMCRRVLCPCTPVSTSAPRTPCNHDNMTSPKHRKQRTTKTKDERTTKRLRTTTKQNKKHKQTGRTRKKTKIDTHSAETIGNIALMDDNKQQRKHNTHTHRAQRIDATVFIGAKRHNRNKHKQTHKRQNPKHNFKQTYKTK